MHKVNISIFLLLLKMFYCPKYVQAKIRNNRQRVSILMNEFFYYIYFESRYQGITVLINEMREINFTENTDFIWTIQACINKLHLYGPEILTSAPNYNPPFYPNYTRFYLLTLLSLYFLTLITDFLNLWWYAELNKIYKQQSRKNHN